jgi:hypothetical protein
VSVNLHISLSGFSETAAMAEEDRDKGYFGKRFVSCSEWIRGAQLGDNESDAHCWLKHSVSDADFASVIK